MDRMVKGFKLMRQILQAPALAGYRGRETASVSAQTDAQIEQLGVRGVRLDEARSGSGIGISIVREIVAINSGRLAFRRSTLGGLCVAVELPTVQSPQ